MLRRTFVANSLVAAALSAASAPDSNAKTASTSDSNDTSNPAMTPQSNTSTAGKQGLYYELRRYQLVDGPQKKICDAFFQNAFIPAVNRLGITPVGVFNLTVGPGTPAIYVLLPSASVEALV